MPDTPKLGLGGLGPAPVSTAPAQPSPTYLSQLPTLSPEMRHLLVHIFLPINLLVQFEVDPVTWRNAHGEVMVEVVGSEDGHLWGVRLLNDIDRRDPLIELELADTIFNRISVSWVGMNDPRAPRFDIDRLPNGDLTLRGKANRNLPAETAAMISGLAPGQVRKGLGSFRQLLQDLEQFFAALHQYEFEAEPLYYHNAILFERHGFHYLRGGQFMQRIHEGFASGGKYASRLDGSTPFRDPAFANTIRGRSWAIHDGVLDETWDGVKMAKRLGVDTAIDTAPDIGW